MSHGAGGQQGHVLSWTVQRSDRSVGIRRRNGLTNIVERNSARGSRHRIDLHAHREFLRPEDVDQRYAGNLRHLQSEDGLGIIIDRRQRQGLGIGGEEHHRGFARIDLFEAGRHRHLDRQPTLGNRQARLHVERGAIDVAIEIEEDIDLGAAER